MQVVPKNKTLYIGARKFIEGDVLPPYIKMEMPEMTRKEADEQVDEQVKKESKPRSSYRTRSGGMFQSSESADEEK